MAIGKQLLNEFLDKAIGRNVKYSELRKILLEVNQRIKNSNTTIYDHNNQSALAVFRNLIGNSFNSSQTDDSEYLGIVIKVRTVDGREGNGDGLKTRYYIDVPLGDAGTYPLKEPTLAKSDANYMNSISQKIFYAESEYTADNPPPNSIARVKLSQNYSNNISNPLDNKYLGQYINGFTAHPDSTEPETPESKLALKTKALNELKTPAPEISSGSYKLDPKNDDFGQPLASNIITSVIGTRKTGGTVNHLALDLSAAKGTEFRSVSRGVVHSVGTYRITIRYDRGANLGAYYFRYLHLSKISVAVGKSVEKGQVLGLTGDENGAYPPHLHLEVAKDDSGSESARLQPEFILQGTYKVKGDIQSTYGYDASYTFPLPISVTSAEELAGAVNVPATEAAAAATPPVMEAEEPEDEASASSLTGTPQSIPSSAGKLKLVLLETDMPTGIKKTLRLGSTRLKVREDIASDITKIKDILNAFQIPLSVLPNDVRLDNKELSLLGRLGLEIVLNKWLGLADDSNLNTDDYLIGPDYNRKLATGYALKIYGRCKQIVSVPTGKYQPIYEPISVYNIKNTINVAPPEVVKINTPVLDITQIFEEHGFSQALPRGTFFRYSIVDDANWNIFVKPSKITKGYTYREALETVYYVDNSSIWNNKPLVWNGDRFI
jgi:murein DD-endopeptidase MepM/ murein hydrolase activator NlpD